MSSTTSEETALNETAHDVQILFPSWIYVTCDNWWYDIVSFAFWQESSSRWQLALSFCKLTNKTGASWFSNWAVLFALQYEPMTGAKHTEHVGVEPS